jgi:hypothetical protein
MSNAEGKPNASAPAAPKDARLGATRRSVAGTAGRCRNRGDSGNASAGTTGSEAQGETPGLCAGCAEGCENRGDSKIHRRQGRKMQKPG